MNDIKLQKNFDTWCKRNLQDLSFESKKHLWLMYMYFSNRIVEKDNKIAKLEERIKDLEDKDDPSFYGTWLGY